MSDYPEDIIKAAREAVATFYDGLWAKNAASDVRAGRRDHNAEVRCSAAAILAERQRCAGVAESFGGAMGQELHDAIMKGGEA